MVKRHYEEFAYPIADTQLTHQELLDRRAVVRVPTGASTDHADQYLAVSRTEPEAGVDPTLTPVACFPAFSDEPVIRRDNAAPFRQAQANLTGRIIYTVQAPGVHFFAHRSHEDGITHRTTPDQREELTKGVWLRIAAAQLQAIREADRHFNDGHRRQNESYFLHGSSQAAAFVMGAVAAKFAADDRSFTLDGAAIIEPVNLIDRSSRVLGAQFMAQAQEPGYLEQNPPSIRDSGESMAFWALRTLASASANLRYGRALTRRDPRPLGDLSLLHDAEIPIVTSRGTASELCDQEGYERLVRDLGRAGVKTASLIRKDHDHAFTLAVAAFGQDIEALTQLAA